MVAKLVYWNPDEIVEGMRFDTASSNTRGENKHAYLLIICWRDLSYNIFSLPSSRAGTNSRGSIQGRIKAGADGAVAPGPPKNRPTTIPSQ